MGTIANVNNSVPLNHYFKELPSVTAKRHERKALCFNVLEKICWVAFIAIAAIILTVSYTGLALTGNLPILLVGGLLTVLFAVPLATKLHQLRMGHSKIQERENGVDKEYQKIKDKNEDHVRQFLIEQKIDIQQIPIEALKKKDKPLCALLPLIARFNYFKGLSEALEKESRETLETRVEEPANPNPINQNILILNRQNAYDKHEKIAIPRALEAAVILQIIQQPTLNLELPQIGKFNIKSFEERQFDKKYGPFTDRYFTLNGGKILKLSDIEQDMRPSTLRPLLFA